MSDSSPENRALVRWFAGLRRHRFDILLGALILLLISTPVVRLFGPGFHPALSRFTVTTLFMAFS